MKCGERIQTDLLKTVVRTNNYRSTAKAYKANTMQLERLHLKKKIDNFLCRLLA